jgi:hypothetical protein
MTNNNNEGKIPNVPQQGFSSFRTDLFGRIKTSEPYTVFDSSHRYKESGDFSKETSGTATVSHLTNESSLSLAIGSASGDKVTLESFKTFPYQPGKSLQVMQTFVMAPPKANLRQRVGYFSRQNGIYLEQDGTSVYLVKRSYISGEVVNTRVAQSDWNIDQLNGDGPSDIVLDLSKAQIFWTEYEWLGVGSVRCGFAIDGYFIPVHAFHHANKTTSVYITTASLPLRYEVENTGATSSSSTMKQICATVISNGGYTRKTEHWTASRSTQVGVAGDFYPIVSIRLASARTDSVIVPNAISILGRSSGDYEYALIKNATLTGGTWVPHTESTGNVEYNITQTVLTGGTIVEQGFFSSSNQSIGSVSLGDIFRWDIQLGRTNATTPTSDTLTLAVRSLGGTQNVVGSISWLDIV